MKGRVVMTSFGFNTKTGFELLEGVLKKDGDLSDKVIYLFYEPYFALREKFLWASQKLGFRAENVLLSERDEWPANRRVDYVFVGEGNTFESMRILRDKGLFNKIKAACAEEGATYLGASAGAIIAGKNIACAKFLDEPAVRLDEREMEGLGLVDGIVLPHVACLEELSGIDVGSLLKAGDGKTILPYPIANDGIVVVDAK